MVTLEGRLEPALTLADARVLVAAAQHHVRAALPPSALRLYEGDTALHLQEEAGELIVCGEATTHAALRGLAWAASRALAAAGVRHWLAVRGVDGLRLGYFHERWPALRVWVGHRPTEEDLAEGVAACVRRHGGEVLTKGLARWPVGDPLAALLGAASARHDVLVCLLSEDDPHARWVEREVAVASGRDHRRALSYEVRSPGRRRADGADGAEGVDGAKGVDAPRGEALAVSHAILGAQRCAAPRLLVVEQTFRAGERALVLAPELPVALLPGDLAPRELRLGVSAPDGTTALFDAQAVVALPNPPELARLPRYTVMLRGATREDVPDGSEVWLASPSEAEP
ncbi:MAG: hypothetical protein R3B48_29860 [Kofleriaceae bacterium]